MSAMRRGEIYLVELDGTKGSEIKKVRPAVLISNNKANQHAPIVIILPITNRKSRNQPTQVQIRDAMFKFKNKEIHGQVLAEQIRTVDKCRLLGKIGEFNEEALVEIDNAILVSMGIERAL